ncbi:hypothetical protein ABPG72_017931 [Tetrahymena utriculariae]
MFSKTIGSRLQIKEQVGEGNFAKVYLAWDLKLKRNVAVKEIHQNSSAVQMIGNEANALKNIKELIQKIKQKNGVLSPEEQQTLQNSKHILEIEEPYYINENDNSYIIMKYYENCIDFSQFLKTNDTLSKISERDKLNYFYQLTCGLTLLHQQNICHRDLKLDNILINLEQDQLIIIDFGHASLKRQDDYDLCGTKLFNSPQVVLYMSYNAFKNDVWQMGIILYYLIHQKFPFCEKNSGEEEFQKAINDYLHKKRDLQIKENASQIVKDLLQSMLQRYEEARPSIQDVNKKLKDYYLKDKPILNFKGPNQNASREIRSEAQKCTSMLDCDFPMLKNIKKVQVKAQKPKEVQSSQSQYTITPNNNYSSTDNQEILGSQHDEQFYQNQEVYSFKKHENSFYNEQSQFLQFNNSLNNLSINKQNQESINKSGTNKHDFLKEINNKRQQQQQLSITSIEKPSGIQQNRPSINEQKQQSNIITYFENTHIDISISTAVQSLNQNINLSQIIDQFKENIKEIEQIIDSQQNNYNLKKKLTFIKFYLSKLAHFLVQSLYEYSYYIQNINQQCLYTTNFLVQWMAKTKQEESQNKNIQDLIDLSINLKQKFQQSAQFIQKNQSIQISDIFQSGIKNNLNFSKIQNPLEDMFFNHSQDNFTMSNENNFLDYNQLFVNILDYVQKYMQDNNQQFIQEEDKQKLQNIIQKVKSQITKITKITHTKSFNESLQVNSFLSSKMQ